MGGDPKRNPDLFKLLEEILKPDRRQLAYTFIDPVSGQMRPRVLADHYTLIAGFTLVGTAPDKVRVHFETARNLLLYAWFAYRFIPVAEMHAFSTVEMALRLKLGYEESSRGPTLKGLLGEAINRGLICDEGFSHFHMLRERRAEFRESMRGLTDLDDAEVNPTPLVYSRRIVENMPYFRNTFAHGSPMVMPHGYLWLGTCCDLINQICSDVPSPEHGPAP